MEELSLEQELKTKLIGQGVNFIYFVDVSQLKGEQNKGFPRAILFGIALSPDYLQEVSNTPDYVQNMIRMNQIQEDEFHLTELRTDELADDLAEYLTLKGYSAYSQSENNIEATGYYDKIKKRTPLPHKTIALLAGLGWIGKHNLLVNPEYGSAISMCTVLTDAPLKTILHAPSDSQCGECLVCVKSCTEKAIKGQTWKRGCTRDEIVDVYTCNTCLKCLVLCPWTQRYMERNRLK